MLEYKFSKADMLNLAEARDSEYIDEKSGVSARLSISALENLYSNIHRRMLKNKEETATGRISDFWGVIPSITGKVELVYEGEQEGPYNVALHLMSGAIKKMFLEYFDDPDRTTKLEEKDPYGTLRAWFGAANEIDLLNAASNKEYKKKLDSIPGLLKVIQNRDLDIDHPHLFMEFLLHGLTEFEVISKEFLQKGMNFKDPLARMFLDN